MQVICTDGTRFNCEGFELSEYGIALYGQNLAQEKERYDNEPEQTGFVPHDRLWYVLPDGVEPELPPPGVPQGQPNGQQPPEGNQQPPAGQPPIQQLQSQRQRPTGPGRQEQR